MEDELKRLIENNQYRILRKLGEGGFGVVYAALKFSTGEEVALKVMDLRSDKLYKTFQNEVGTTPSHPNIISLDNFYLIKFRGHRFGIMEMEAMEIDLMDYLIDNGTLSEQEVRFIFRQVCEAIACCHQHQISHLDIKADNILLSRNNKGQYKNIKLCDFGHAKHISQFRSNAQFGTPQYLPLEIFSKKYPIIGEKVDVWSLGVLLFTLITGMFPFIINSDRNTIHCLDLSIINQYCDDQRCIQLLTSIFTEDPNERPDIFDILSHPWLVAKEFNAHNFSYPIDGCIENYYYNNNNQNNIDNNNKNQKNSRNENKKKMPKVFTQLLKLKNRISN